MASAYPNPSLSKALTPYRTATAVIAGKGWQGEGAVCVAGKVER